MGKKKTATRPKKKNSTATGQLFVLCGIIAFVVTGAVFYFASSWNTVVYTAPSNNTTALADNQGAIPVVATSTTLKPVTEATTTSSHTYPDYLEVPDAIRAIYMTQCVAGTPSFRNDLIELISETEINAVVIDVKDYTGKLGFDTDHPDLVVSISDQCGARDMASLIKTFHDMGVYTIARITVFQDPFYSQEHPELAVKFETPEGEVWRDHKGLSFIDVGAKPYWEYIVTLSRVVHALGFDELNYDYIRYPSDGPMNNIAFEWAGKKEKQVALEEFFRYLHDEMKDETQYPEGVAPPQLSADLFGMVTTNYDDLNIGQVLERVLPYFDYVAPMVYPSHYPSGFNGWSNPNTVPYELIKYVLDAAVVRVVADSSTIDWAGGEKIYKDVLVAPVGSTTATSTEKQFTGRYTKKVYDKDVIRPWLQDFDYGGDYDIEEVRTQIEATYDAGLDSWMLWAPSNRYTKGALKPFYQAADSATETEDVLSNTGDITSQ